MKKIPQFEFQWGQPEPFRLVAMATLDGEQVAREQRQLELNRKKQEKQQLEINERTN